MNRVVITGMGAVSAAGIGVDALWNKTRAGKTTARKLDIPYVEKLRVRIGARVPDFDPAVVLGNVPQTADRCSMFAVAAAREAVDHSGIDPEILSGIETAAVIGTGIGGAQTIEENSAVFFDTIEGKTRLNPMAVPRVMPSSAVSHVGIGFGIRGPSFGVVSACASGAQSIGIAAQMVRNGMVKRALAGGTEACVTATVLKSWEALRVLAPKTCQPFSVGRRGLVMGEGAGIFMLETEEAALARGAEPLAYLTGYGTTSDARDMVQPDVDGASGAIRVALEDAQVKPDEVSYINAHGTGTILNDISEARALRQVFGDLIDEIPVSSSKPTLGHTLGAAGALELVVAVQALRNQEVPPQANLTEMDPKCPLFLPTGGPMKRNINVVLSNSFAFGGINASLIAQRFA